MAGLTCWLVSVTVAVSADQPQQVPGVPADLTGLSLEALMNIEVTSAAKKAEKLSEAAAAAFVITQEDIRRSGATSIPELLRMVPGVQVGRIDANTWGVSARGFNDEHANKLLVLVDGRTIYDPLFSGVRWEFQDTLLEDIDRIEVVRGPGGTLWGANAVNGVINIITKEAWETQGSLVTTGGGTEERGLAGVRYGGRVGDDGHYRVYAKWFDRDDSPGGADDWQVTTAGFRTDWASGDRDSLTLQGDYYDRSTGQTVTRVLLTPPFSETLEARPTMSGGNLLFCWERRRSEGSDTALQLYYDRINWDSPFLGEERDTVDLDFQHRFPLGDRHDVLWGLGYRFTADDTEASSAVSLDPEGREDHLFSAFIQDEITLLEDRLKLTVGSKFEHNDYTGFEVQPSARLLWSPGEGDTVWAAFSRAVRTPSQADRAARINLAALEVPDVGLGLVSVFADPDVGSEDLLACEVGYRAQPSDRLFLDVAGFYNRYDDLVAAEAGLPFLEPSPAPPHVVLPFYGGNKMTGQTCGIEVASGWQVLDWWRVHAAYSYLMMDLDKDSGDTVSANDEGTSPLHQFSLRSMMDLPSKLEFDWWLRYADSLDSLSVGSYFGLDLRLGWRPTEKLEVSIVGQNLLESHTPQFASALVSAKATRVERGVYADATWRF